MAIIVTLCFIRDKNRLLLALKKRGFGAGKWNGFGGKIGEHETIEVSAIRETKEECGIDIEKLEKRAVINFILPKQQIECHVFEITKYSGEPIETEEMKPQWFEIDKLPYESMWSDDPIWLPLFLDNKKFKARFIFDEHDQVIDHEINF